MKGYGFLRAKDDILTLYHSFRDGFNEAVLYFGENTTNLPELEKCKYQGLCYTSEHMVLYILARGLVIQKPSNGGW